MRLPLIVASLLLGGCVHQSLPTTLYQLDQSSPELPGSKAGRSVLLGPLQVADYLQREAIVQRGQDNSLRLAASARWAGSLDDDIGRLLVNQLASRLGTSRIALFPDRVGFKPEVQVLLDISRLDSGPQQPAVLEARWRLMDGDQVLQASRVLRLSEHHDGTTASQIAAQSSLLRQLAGEITSDIRGLPQRSVSRHERPAPTPSRPAVQSLPPIPEVRPSPAGVYRF